MNLPISTTLMIAALTVLRVLCFIIAVLFLLLGLRAQFDDAVNMPVMLAVGSALGFTGAALACGWLRGLVIKRRNGG